MNKNTLEQLTRIFEIVGADDPKSWAYSEINEDIPQLARYLFLRQAWLKIVSEDDTSWMEEEIEYATRNPGYPTTGLGLALDRLISSGVDKDDINEIVRVMQYKLLFDLCYLLEDPGKLETEVEDIYWQLYEMDSEDKPSRFMGGLHESVMSMDPTGREMRPKNYVG